MHYPDISLAVIKLMGPGEYVLFKANDPEPLGHFGLAAQDYAHSTAPNRRFADLVTQRLVKAMLDGEPAPYSDTELAAIALQCNLKEHASHKVERAMQKRVAAVALADSVGKVFHGVVTGARREGDVCAGVRSSGGGPRDEGRAGDGCGGSRLTVKLLDTDPQMRLSILRGL